MLHRSVRSGIGSDEQLNSLVGSGTRDCVVNLYLDLSNITGTCFTLVWMGWFVVAVVKINFRQTSLLNTDRLSVPSYVTVQVHDVPSRLYNGNVPTYSRTKAGFRGNRPVQDVIGRRKLLRERRQRKLSGPCHSSVFPSLLFFDFYRKIL